MMKIAIFMILFLPWHACAQLNLQTMDANPSEERSFTEQLKMLSDLPGNERHQFVGHILALFPNSPVIENDTTCSLYYYGAARQVLVHGDFQGGWARPDTMHAIPLNDSTFFHITYTLPRDARLDYQFQADTIYMTDPRNPSITPSGYGPHSEIAMPGFVPDPLRWPRESIPHGTIEDITLTSSDPDIKSRPGKVYLPAGYEKLSELPVLYVLDGLEALVFMNYRHVLDNLIADGKINPLIVVFIPPQDRGGEFMDPRIRGSFIKVLNDDFIATIDKKFRTSPKPEDRGVTGISAGGCLALYLVLNHPDIFLCGAGQSPTITGEILHAVKKMPEKMKSNPGLRIYMDMGRYDLPAGLVGKLSFLEAAESLHRQMQEEEIPHMFQVVNDGHEWANWRERTDDILLYFFITLPR